MYQYYALYHYVNIYHVFHVLFMRFMLFICIVYGDEHVCLWQIKSFDLTYLVNLFFLELLYQSIFNVKLWLCFLIVIILSS